MVEESVLQAMIAAARAARVCAYAPYSNYRVGAAVVVGDGRIFSGCNIENASYGACLCAERSAIAHMVGAGASRPVACVVVTAGPVPGSPCGICRQVLAEFAQEMDVIMVADGVSSELRRETTLTALLPDAFIL